MTDQFNFLRKVPLFSGLSDADLEQLCRSVREVRLTAGEELFSEGSLGQEAYIVKEGQLEIYKTSAEHKVQLAIRQAGEMIGEISQLESSPRTASVQALTDSLLLVIQKEQIEALLNTSPSAARTMLSTIIDRLRSTELLLHQNEKMAQLGTLSAGIAHELNNPAAAARRGAEQLKITLDELDELQFRLNGLGLTPDQTERLRAWRIEIRRRAQNPPRLEALARSDAETALGDWLEAHQVENGWKIAPRLADLGLSLETLASLAADFPPAGLSQILDWMAETANAFSLLEEIGQGAARISEIVQALKAYVYLDQAPIQKIDLHEGLENTLVILRGKLKHGVEVDRQYDPSIPPIEAYGSELNQAWTNLIDNAIDAMDGKGKLSIRTAYQDPWVVVRIEDNGPGIPPELQSRLFSPFFTTKPLGKGTGLGLNITYNIIHKHSGEIKVVSQPGQTIFEVWLPVNFEKTQKGAPSLEPIHRGDDGSLGQLLERVHTIAVVGMSDKPDRPAHSVPAYLQKHGFRIIPVNPTIRAALGEPAFPDLQAVPEPVDTVLIFRASEKVPPIVDQAIDIGAKIIWMQEGIRNEAAAQKASAAGIEVVMDACMSVVHRRLVGSLR